jgi:hypothetical protein
MERFSEPLASVRWSRMRVVTVLDHVRPSAGMTFSIGQKRHNQHRSRTMRGARWKADSSM